MKNRSSKKGSGTVQMDADLFQRIFDSVQNGIMITDPDGYVVYMNRPYGRYLNLKTDEQFGRHCTTVVENSRMHIVGQTGKAEINHIHEIKGENIVVQRIPVKKDGRVIAVFGLVMFSDLRQVTKLAKKIDLLESKVKLYEAELLNLRSCRYTFDSIIGDSPPMKSLKREALRATSNSFPVMISGECGTGKELFAQAIHHSSARKVHPFVRINCAAIPHNLLESELFGYDKGAFTGARTGGKPGKFELAHQGSIFLDEIGDMPLEMQPKLLRVLEDKEFERVGGNKIIKSDFRLITATNRDLTQMVDQGGFRRDLYYRLNVIPLHIPPLRGRTGDIPLLTEKLLERMAERADVYGDIRIEETALNALSRHPWPGNVRELSNVLERTLSMLDGPVINMDDLPFYLHPRENEPDPAAPDSLKSAQQDVERKMIKKTLAGCGYNKARAARKLGIHRTLLYKKLKKYSIPLNP